MKKAVQFGAGNIGRGFLGQLFNQSGYEIVFVELQKDVIAYLNREHSYKLRIVGENPQELVIDRVRAVDGRDKFQVGREIKEADIMATAVGARNLSSISCLVAEGMRQRADAKVEAPVNLILCENLPHASKVFKEYLLEEINSGYRDYLDSHLVMVEEYSILPVDKKGFKGKIPEIKGMVPYENLYAYEEQKLFIHNAGHAICAYLGHLKGYEYIWQAIEDEEVYRIVRAGLEETGAALIKKHGFTQEEQRAHIEDLLKRFANHALSDTILRVGRDPIRKLGPQERLIGAAKLAYRYGITPENIARGIAAALLFDVEEDEEARRLSQMRRKEGVDAILKKICQIDPEGPLGKLIKRNLDIK